MVFTTMHGFYRIPVTQHNTPTTATRIALAGTIGIKNNLSRHSSSRFCRFTWWPKGPSVFGVVQIVWLATSSGTHCTCSREAHHLTLAPDISPWNSSTHPFFRKDTVIRPDRKESVTRHAFIKPPGGLAATALKRQAKKTGHRGFNLKVQQMKPILHATAEKKAPAPRASMVSRN